MATQINPALARLWLAQDTRQYGYRNPVVVALENEAAARTLDYLELGVTNSQLSDLPELARAPQHQVSDLFERLSGLMMQTNGFLPELTSAEVSEHFNELARIFLESSEDPAEVLARRLSSLVFLESVGRTGFTIARGLAASKIGRIITMDQKRIASPDCQPLGFETALIGQTRVQGAQRQLGKTKIELHSRITATLARVDLAVLIATDIVEPASYQPWMTREVPHLSVVFDEEGVEISPLIIPGVTPCLACIELHRMDTIPSWNLIAPQLANLERSLEDSAMLLFAAGIVLNQTLNLIDIGSTTSSGLAHRLSRRGKLESFEVSSRQCGCRSVL